MTYGILKIKWNYFSFKSFIIKILLFSFLLFFIRFFFFFLFLYNSIRLHIKVSNFKEVSEIQLAVFILSFLLQKCNNGKYLQF